MAIEIIPKEAKKFPLWQNILFYFSLVLFLSCLSGLLILNFLEKKSQLTLDNLKETLEKGMTTEKKALEKEILTYQKKIDDFSILLADYRVSSRFFDFLEKIIHPKVFFSELNLSSKEGKVSLTGQTESFETLGQQILIFQKEEKLRGLKLAEIKIGKEGKIDFSLEISFDPKIFTQ